MRWEIACDIYQSAKKKFEISNNAYEKALILSLIYCDPKGEAPFAGAGEDGEAKGEADDDEP